MPTTPCEPRRKPTPAASPQSPTDAPRPRSGWLADARHYQIAVLSALLGYGILAVGVPVGPLRLGLVLATTLGCQWLWTRLRGGRLDFRSPLISGMSLCLLMRTGSLGLLLLGAAVAISSKFVLRSGGRHVFNPTNFALVVLMAASDRVWVSPGQWGSAAYVGLLLAGLGGLVVYRAARADVTLAFLGWYGALVLGRAIWLGDPLTVPLHHLQNGALLIFAFFMISDPKTTPDSRAGRVLFAALVALGSAYVHFVLYRQHGPIWSLAVAALFVPLINRLLPGPLYRWGGSHAAPSTPAIPSCAGDSPRLDPSTHLDRPFGQGDRHVPHQAPTLTLPA